MPRNTGLDAVNEDKEGALYISDSFEGVPKSDIAPLAKIQAAALGIRCVFTKNTLTSLSTSSELASVDGLFKKFKKNTTMLLILIMSYRTKSVGMQN